LVVFAFVVLGDATKNTIKVSGFHHTKADHVGQAKTKKP